MRNTSLHAVVMVDGWIRGNGRCWSWVLASVECEVNRPEDAFTWIRWREKQQSESRAKTCCEIIYDLIALWQVCQWHFSYTPGRGPTTRIKWQSFITNMIFGCRLSSIWHMENCRWSICCPFLSVDFRQYVNNSHHLNSIFLIAFEYSCSVFSQVVSRNSK